MDGQRGYWEVTGKFCCWLETCDVCKCCMLFVTALFECFIRLGYQAREFQGNVLSMVKNDFSGSIRFIMKERPDIMKMLLLAAFSRFFVMGVTLVGLPFLVRAVLGLDAKFYGRSGERD